MNPGPSMAPIEPPRELADGDEPKTTSGDEAADAASSRFGLMASFVQPLDATRLPQALALGAGEHIQIPPGQRCEV